MRGLLLLLTACDLFPGEDERDLKGYGGFLEAYCDIYNVCLTERGMDTVLCDSEGIEFDCDFDRSAAEDCLASFEEPCDAERLNDFPPCLEVCFF
jgi:hypothetical protein